MNILAITNHNGIRIAEVGFAIGAIGGILLALPARRGGSALGGFLIAAGFVLAIVATHWGHFG
jgi:hypothetical protein